MIYLFNALRLASVLIVFSILAACGGGGGGGGGGGSSNPPPVVDAANHYLPTDPSVRWNYSGGGQLYFEPGRSSGGVQLHSLVYQTGGKEYFVTDATQISLKGLFIPSISVGDGVVYTGDIKFDTPLAIFSSDWSAGYGVGYSGSGKINISPKYGNRTAYYSGTASYEGEQDVTTALGTFRARKTTVIMTITVTVDGYTFSLPYNVSFYLAKDLGIVRREQSGINYVLSSVSGPDRDGDGMPDALDKFPDLASEVRDTDGDGVGDNSDPDIDNDGIANGADKFPANKTEWADLDNDGIGDNADSDDDNDGVYDVSDDYPANPQRQYRLHTQTASIRQVVAYGGVQPVSKDVYLYTGGSNNSVINWNATSSAPWLQFDKAQSGYLLQGTARIDSSGLALGGYDASLTIADNDTGEQIVIPVHIEVEMATLYGSDAGVALSSIPSGGKLSQVVTVKNSLDLPNVAWSATTDQPWLSATVNGAGTAPMTIAANPVGLAPNTTYYATVTLNSADPSVDAIKPIRVALWVGSNNPGATFEVQTAYTEIAADPLRPYVYTHRGGGDIDIYNVYTHALVNSITAVGSALGHMEVGDDGSYLYAFDKSTVSVVRIDLDQPQTRAVIPVDGTNFTQLRSNGHTLLVTSPGHFFDAANGQRLASGDLSLGATYSHFSQLTGSDKIFCGIEDSKGALQNLCYSAAYNSFQGGFVELVFKDNDFNNGAVDVALSPDGIFAYVAEQNSQTTNGQNDLKFYGRYLPSQSTFYLDAATAPANVEVGYDGTLIGSAGNQVWVYETWRAQRLNVSVNGGNILNRQLTLSGDGAVASALTADRMVFIRAY